MEKLDIKLTDEEMADLREHVHDVIYWLSPDRRIDRSDTAVYAVEHMTKIGKIIAEAAIAQGWKI